MHGTAAEDLCGAGTSSYSSIARGRGRVDSSSEEENGGVSFWTEKVFHDTVSGWWRQQDFVEIVWGEGRRNEDASIKKELNPNILSFT